jgi:hypothetical protein
VSFVCSELETLLNCPMPPRHSRKPGNLVPVTQTLRSNVWSSFWKVCGGYTLTKSQGIPPADLVTSEQSGTGVVQDVSLEEGRSRFLLTCCEAHCGGHPQESTWDVDDRRTRRDDNPTSQNQAMQGRKRVPATPNQIPLTRGK